MIGRRLNHLLSIATMAAVLLLADSSALADAATRAAESDIESTIQELPSYGSALLRMFGVLAAMVAVLLVAVRYLPRWFGVRGDRAGSTVIEIVAVRQIEPNKRLHLVRVAGKYLLIAASGERVNLIAGSNDLDAAAIDAELAASSATSTIARSDLARKIRTAALEPSASSANSASTTKAVST